ncbi:MAG: hypothetical protein ACPGSM_21445 [Thiolinea sp.]
MTTPISAKCDWLTLTYSPEDFPSEEIKADLLQSGATIKSEFNGKKETLFLNGGTVLLQMTKAWHRASFSGRALEYLRTIGRYDSMLALLATSPHKVTRLDAAYDISTDAPPLLAKLIKKYPNGKVRLTGKEVSCEERMAIREDRKRTGTLEYGLDGDAKVQAIVYDKAWEAWKKRREKLPPTIRYEIRALKGEATLKDAYNPTPLFWHFAAPALLKLPKPAPEKWLPGGDLIGWEYKKPETLPIDTFKKYIHKNSATEIELADAMGAYGRETALYERAKILGLELPCPPVRAAQIS